MDIGQISLRERERGFVVGGTGVGKSWLAEALMVDYVRRYRSARVLILDSKPRFRAAWMANGRAARRRFKRWGHGAEVADAVVVLEPDDLELAWKTGHRIAIAQPEDVTGPDQEETARRLNEIAARFFAQANADRPQLLYVDEAMDFYRQTGAPISRGDAIRRSARAGRELGCGLLLCSQRTKGIPAQVMEELSKLYLFRLDYQDDAKRLQEMGAPRDLRPPTEAHAFRYWTKADYLTIWPKGGGVYRLDTPARAR